MSWSGFIGGALVGVGVTAWAVPLAVASGGAGHGGYVAARLLFPHAMLMTRLAGDTITPPLMLLALAQFPLYGGVIGLAVPKGRGWTALALVALLHAAAAGLCFSGMLPNFSGRP